MFSSQIPFCIFWGKKFSKAWRQKCGMKGASLTGDQWVWYGSSIVSQSFLENEIDFRCQLTSDQLIIRAHPDYTFSHIFYEEKKGDFSLLSFNKIKITLFPPEEDRVFFYKMDWKTNRKTFCASFVKQITPLWFQRWTKKSKIKSVLQNWETP